MTEKNIKQNNLQKGSEPPLRAEKPVDQKPKPEPKQEQKPEEKSNNK
jgi:hypothetical protein